MSAHDPHTLPPDTTPEGEQTLIPVSGQSPRATGFSLLIHAPMRPRKARKPLDIGLFDEGARNELDPF
ncbi:hypothetical protein CK215_24570 [Mesorhizobium sp. WSM3864]|uniref:hypothetical protein n=1 Tax=Mesorhizobium sp. WSM3864 TaxID=2029404 RepID=UPI000BAEFFA8|nr:hypothetical protein [Mesorhizobium sp. WSM3864]PBB89940.1 hypothetical protein CK215_24570 [Mesorhizobium sp. WSM3864]